MRFRSPISRRHFLAQSSALAAAAQLPSIARAQQAAPREESPNEKLNVAFIGVGGRGSANLQAVAAGGAVNVVALCDVSEDHLDRAAQQHPQARTFRDFRRFYDNPGSIDAVVVSTPEHTHAFATMPALQLGKHVYCEKPLAHNIRETRQITLAAARAGVATQMGTQIHATPNYRRVVELVQSGAIGPVREAHVWVSRAWGLQSQEEAKQNGDIVYVTERPSEAMRPPANLDWDLWLGPAPQRPYHDVYLPGPKWYRWWDFGSGTMSDLGSHWNDLPFWALQLDAPQTVEAMGLPPHAELAPASMSAVYEYGPRGELPACRLHWYQGSHKPEIWKQGRIPQWNSGVLFIGDAGMLLADYGRHMLLPEEKFVDFTRPEPFLADSPGHHQEWLIACKTGAATGSPFSYAGPLTEANHLGNVAYRVGKKLHWDAAAMRATHCPEADAFIGRQPRQGWTL